MTRLFGHWGRDTGGGMAGTADAAGLTLGGGVASGTKLADINQKGRRYLLASTKETQANGSANAKTGIGVRLCNVCFRNSYKNTR
jgi:hypothetical protein